MTLVRYLSRVFATRFLAVLLALVALVELIEMLEAVRRLLGAHSGLRPMLIFSVLKLPLAMEKLFPLAVLIGAALTFRSLVQNNELPILRGAGLSPYRLLSALLPVTMLLAAVHFVVVDRVAPTAERAFAEWWRTIAPKSEEDQAKESAVWLHAGDEIVSVARVLDDGTRLEGVTRYGRSGGLLNGRIRAASATFDNGAWRLHDVEVIRIEGASPHRTHYDELPWPNGPATRNLVDLTLSLERTSGTQARDVLTGEWSGDSGTAYYRTAVHKSLSAPLLPFLMVLLAAPALGGGRRGGGMARGMTVSLLMGLSFVVLNGLFTSMGEAGALPAVLAVWTSPLIFLACGGALLLYGEE